MKIRELLEENNQKRKAIDDWIKKNFNDLTITAQNGDIFWYDESDDHEFTEIYDKDKRYKLSEIGEVRLRLEALIDESGQFSDEFQNITRFKGHLKNGVSYITWPVLPKEIDVLDLESSGTKFEIKDFNGWPNTGVIDAGAGYGRRLTIYSFAGIDKLTNLKRLAFECDTIWIKGGVLRLLKCPSLTEVKLESYDDSLENLQNIINKHLKNKNIPECQQELIEEELQEYAKL